MRKLIPGRGLLVLLGALFVSGCALPVPIQVASWALDGISYLATKKSVTDHGISFVTQKDCALWRTVQGKDICDSYDDAGTTAVAALGPDDIAPEPVITEQDIAIIEKNTEFTETIAIDTASGDEQASVANIEGGAVQENAGAADVVPAPVAVPELPVPEALPIVAAVAIEAEPSALEVSAEPVVVATKEAKLVVVAVEPTHRTAEKSLLLTEPAPVGPVQVAAVVPEITENPAIETSVSTGERILIPGQRAWSDKPDANIYYVIGSFQNRANAKRLVKRHVDLGPSVMATRVKGVETYRVAVGPFTRVEQRSVRWAIRQTGIRDSWAISIDPSQWMIAGPTVPVKAPVANNKPAVEETASLPSGLNRNITNLVQDIDNKEIISENFSSDAPSVGSEAGQNTLYVVASAGHRLSGADGEQITEGPSGKVPERTSWPVMLRDQIGRVINLT